MKELAKSFRDREFPEKVEVAQILFPFIQKLAEERKDVASQHFSENTCLSSFYSAGPSTIMWHVDNEHNF